MYAIFEFKKLKEECVVLLWNRNKTKHTAISVLAPQVYKMDSTICTVQYVQYKQIKQQWIDQMQDLGHMNRNYYTM